MQQTTSVFIDSGTTVNCCMLANSLPLLRISASLLFASFLSIFWKKSLHRTIPHFS